MIMMRLIVLVGLFLTSACTRNSWLASVGDEKITQEQLNTHLKMMRVLGNHYDEKAALKTLVFAKQGALILKKKGNSVEGEANQYLVQKKEEAKRNPVLKEFLEKYGSHPELTSLYLVPEMVPHKLQKICTEDVTYNKDGLEKAERLLASTKDKPASLEEVASSMDIAVVKGTLNKKTSTISWDQSREVASTLGIPSAPWFIERLVEKNKNNQLDDQVHSLYFGFMVVRRDPSESMDVRKFSVAVIPKKKCAEWVNANMAGIPQAQIPKKKNLVSPDEESESP